MAKPPGRRRLKDFGGEASDFKKADYAALVKALQFHSLQYYTEDDPEIADDEYDRLLRLLQGVEDVHPDWQQPDSPTLKVGGEIKSDFPSVRHNPAMMSLDNAMDWDEMVDFDGRVRKNLDAAGHEGVDLLYHVEPKFDGLAVELEYEKGRLVRGSTRGDGVEGEEITHNLKTVFNVLLALKTKTPPEYLSVRGECLLRFSDFIRINEELEGEGKKVYANPRNLAAGSLRQKDSSLTAKRRLLFYPYSIGRIEHSRESEKNLALPALQHERWNTFFPKLGFQVSDLDALGELDEVQQRHDYIMKKRAELPFDIDGLVVKLNDSTVWSELGQTSKFPRWAIAYKFPARSGITRLQNVIFSVGRTGVVTPIADLAPSNIGGVMVKRASLHNEKEIERLGVKVGQLVEVKRAGDVIPKVVASVAEDNPPAVKKISFPKKCPTCETQLIREEIYIRCPNEECPDRVLQTLQFWVSKAGLDIDGLGAEWVAKLRELGLVADIADFFTLRLEHLQDLEGMGDILPQKMLAAIDSRRSVKLPIFLQALGIPNVGPHIAEVLANTFGSLQALQAASQEELSAIHEIGDIIAESVCAFFSHSKNLALLDKLAAAGFVIEEVPIVESEGLPLDGQTFVFTGTLEQVKRDEAQKMVKKLGAKAAGSVSKNTTYVVAGEKAGSKLKKAEELGVPVMTEQEFISFMEKY